VAVCTAAGFQIAPTLVADGAGGAIVTWYDRRNSPDADIYAQRIPLISAPSSVPETAMLSLRNFPNPFNPRTTISFDLPTAGAVRMEIFDMAGRLVRTLVDSDMSAGSHDVVWDGLDASGRGLGSGSYVARLAFGGKVEVVRMGLIR
jgi:hypothetical protein